MSHEGPRRSSVRVTFEVSVGFNYHRQLIPSLGCEAKVNRDRQQFWKAGCNEATPLFWIHRTHGSRQQLGLVVEKVLACVLWRTQTPTGSFISSRLRTLGSCGTV